MIKLTVTAPTTIASVENMPSHVNVSPVRPARTCEEVYLKGAAAYTEYPRKLRTPTEQNETIRPLHCIVAQD